MHKLGLVSLANFKVLTDPNGLVLQLSNFRNLLKESLCGPNCGGGTIAAAVVVVVAGVVVNKRAVDGGTTSKNGKICFGECSGPTRVQMGCLYLSISVSQCKPPFVTTLSHRSNNKNE